MTTYDVGRLAGLLDEQVSWLAVHAADRLPGPDWISCADWLSAQQAGADPTAGWRTTLHDETTRQYGVEPPRQVAAMFVLMWYVSVPAYVAALSCAQTGMSPDVAPSALAFRRHPTQHFPAEIALLSDRVLPLPAAVAEVDRHCRAFTDSYRPGVKLSSRQRYGAVTDEIRSALGQTSEAPYLEQTAAAFGVRLDAMRTSCCFFYALPGVTACSTCPRVA